MSKQTSERVIEAGKEIAAIAVAFGCDNVVGGKPCKQCIARVLGMVAGAGLLHSDELSTFLETYQNTYNHMADKFGLDPVYIRAFSLGDYNPEAN